MQEQPEKSSHPKPPLHIRFWMSLRMGVVGKLLPVWGISLAASLFVVYILQNLLPGDANPTDPINTSAFIITAFVSMACMYIDASLGMGYGTTLTPILLLMGYNPLDVIPSLLVCQWLAGIAAGISHQSAGNIDLSTSSPHFKIAVVLSACGVVGALSAVKVAISIDSAHLTLFIGLVVLIVGIVIFITRNKQYRFSWRKIVFLGLVASFNKGLSAGGYGPLVTGGQMLSGVGGKQAIGITALSEGLTCLVATTGFLASGNVSDLSLAFPLVTGALCSVPLSAYTVRSLPVTKLKTLVATLTIILGVVTTAKAIMKLYGN